MKLFPTRCTFSQFAKCLQSCWWRWQPLPFVGKYQQSFDAFFPTWAKTTLPSKCSQMEENPNSTSQSESMWSSLVISTEDALIVVAVYAVRSIHVCQSSISNPKIIKSCSTIIFRFIFYNYFGKSVRLRSISEEVYHWWVTSNLKESSTRSSVNNAKDWLDQLFLFPGLVCKRVSPMDVITRGHSTTIFLCTRPFSA